MDLHRGTQQGQSEEASSSSKRATASVFDDDDGKKKMSANEAIACELCGKKPEAQMGMHALNQSLVEFHSENPLLVPESIAVIPWNLWL